MGADHDAGYPGSDSRISHSRPAVSRRTRDTASRSRDREVPATLPSLRRIETVSVYPAGESVFHDQNWPNLERSQQISWATNEVRQDQLPPRMPRISEVKGATTGSARLRKFAPPKPPASLPSAGRSTLPPSNVLGLRTIPGTIDLSRAIPKLKPLQDPCEIRDTLRLLPARIEKRGHFPEADRLHVR